MRALFSSFVAVSLLFHAAFGCCWHHVHELGYEASHGEAIAVEFEHQCHEAMAGGHSHDCDPAHSPHQGHSHCQGTCSYLPVQKTQLDKFSADSTLDLAVTVPTMFGLQFVAQTHGELSLDAPAQPPLRLHLFHQILLI